MSGGLFGLLDDIAALARLAAASIDDVGAAAGKASVKAAGVVVDDTAVTPQYVQGMAAKRELPMIRKIAIGSLRNKLVFILPAVLVLHSFLPWALPVLLICGGLYLCYEGAEKVWAKLRGHGAEETHPEVLADGSHAEQEATMVAGAIRTDFILSAEIMVISLDAILDATPDAGVVQIGAVLVVVALFITALVYGVVAVIVKMDDVGLALAQRKSAGSQRLGHALVAAMPRVLDVISVVGVGAMIWVGGHILLAQAAKLGLEAPYDWVHHLEEAAAHAVPAVGGLVGWLVNTFFSAILGLLVGLLVVGVMHLLPFGHSAERDDAEDTPPAH